MMWADISEHLPDFESAVLTSLDEEDYPYSVRCHPVLDDSTETLRVELPPGTPVRPGPASLLCHRHDEDLWNLKSFLVRGVLDPEGEGFVFRPDRFIPAAGIGGPVGVLRFILGSRRNAKLYLRRRGLSRPGIPWDDINAAREQSAREG